MPNQQKTDSPGCLTERMNILQSRESIENPLELLAESLLCVLDLPSIETCMAEKRFFLSATNFQPRILLHPPRFLTQLIGSPNTSNTADLESSTNLRRKLSLRATQDNVQEFLAGGHRCDLIER